MALTPQDKIEIDQRAGIIAERIIEKVLSVHVKTCPHGMAIMQSKYFLIGTMAACTLSGGGIGALVVKVLMG